MRVAHLCEAFSPLSETFIYDYVTELERQGVENHVLTHRRCNEAERPFARVTVLPKPGLWNARRLRHRLLEIFGHGERSGSSEAVLRSDLEKALRRLRPDVVHAHFGPVGVRVAPVAEALGLPLVVTFYGYDVAQLPRSERWRQAYRRLWSRVQAVTALSAIMKSEIAALGCPLERIRVVHLSRDLSAFAYEPAHGPVRRFVSVGRLVEKKGHADAIRAFKEIRAQGGHDAHLRIIGDGPLRERLRAQIRADALEDCVDLAGALPNAQVAEWLRTADAFLLCSRTAPNGDREGTPTVLVEAQAVGLPCVATRHAGIPEMLPESNHWLLAEEGDVDGLAARMRRLMEASPEALRALAEAGHKKVEADFNLAREAEKLRALYASAASSAGAV